MNAPVHPVDHGEGFPGQFIMHSLSDKTPGDLWPVLLAIDHVVRDGPLDPLFCQCAMHDRDRRPAQAELAQSLLGLLGDDPARRSVRRSKPPSFQPLQSADYQAADFGVSLVNR